ncbi:ABC transporter substrate-binding protein [Pseudomonas putida]|uniref:Leucine-binding protein domain-containing protein n=1 Tax=Pseudomonas putida TaxID=303 RepID=A0AAD0LCA4_PSEPU|nr:ABC transporter substrate-binding protein [Pseudomonas putida]AXA26702.1 hypothetical protein C1S65_22230 [Pseudomonas putida]
MEQVGIVGPFTGPRAAYGRWLRRAASGTTLRVCWADDGADPALALVAARRLLEAGVSAVVGHFNSECARVAGALYQAAGVPLLLPAATAPDLCQAVGAYRLCASERHQVAAMLEYLAGASGYLEEVWSDGSVYGERLAQSLRAGVGQVPQPRAGPPIHALMGSHVKVAQQIRLHGRSDTLYLLPDDCVIDEFDVLLEGYELATLCPHATPDFGTCVRLALGHVETAIAQGRSVAEYLRSHPDFQAGEHRHAGFTLVRRDYRSAASLLTRMS